VAQDSPTAEHSQFSPITADLHLYLDNVFYQDMGRGAVVLHTIVGGKFQLFDLQRQVPVSLVFPDWNVLPAPRIGESR
jgi:hypothetical protein